MSAILPEFCYTWSKMSFNILARRFPKSFFYFTLSVFLATFEWQYNISQFSESCKYFTFLGCAYSFFINNAALLLLCLETNVMINTYTTWNANFHYLLTSMGPLNTPMLFWEITKIEIGMKKVEILKEIINWKKWYGSNTRKMKQFLKSGSILKFL